MAAPGNPPGAIWAGMTGLQGARFDKLVVWEPITQGYIDVALALEELREEMQKYFNCSRRGSHNSFGNQSSSTGRAEGYQV